MASRGSFLHRLARLQRAGDVDGVVRNLRFMFNTKKRCGSVLPEFGLGDYEAASNTRDAVEMLRAEMLGLVRSHEPRLADPAVVLLGRRSVSTVRFSLTGRVDGAPWTFLVDIDTTYRSVDVTPERAA